MANQGDRMREQCGRMYIQFIEFRINIFEDDCIFVAQRTCILSRVLIRYVDVVKSRLQLPC